MAKDKLVIFMEGMLNEYRETAFKLIDLIDDCEKADSKDYVDECCNIWMCKFKQLLEE